MLGGLSESLCSRCHNDHESPLTTHSHSIRLILTCGWACFFLSLMLRTLRFREAKELVHRHTASQCWKQEPNPGLGAYHSQLTEPEFSPEPSPYPSGQPWSRRSHRAQPHRAQVRTPALRQPAKPTPASHKGLSRRAGLANHVMPFKHPSPSSKAGGAHAQPRRSV